MPTSDQLACLRILADGGYSGDEPPASVPRELYKRRLWPFDDDWCLTAKGVEALRSLSPSGDRAERVAGGDT